MSERASEEWGITEEDRTRIQSFATKSRYDRSPEDLRPEATSEER